MLFEPKAPSGRFRVIEVEDGDACVLHDLVGDYDSPEKAFEIARERDAESPDWFVYKVYDDQSKELAIP